MVRERHVILKAALHSGLYSCLAAASYILMLYCLVYSFFLIYISIIVFFKLMLVWGTYIIIAIFIYLHSQAPALYIIMIL